MSRKGNTALGIIAGLGIGAALMYAVDPDRGNRRRALAREKLAHKAREFASVAEKGIRDLRNRAQGIFAEARCSLKTKQVIDEVLVDRIRAKIGRTASHPSEIEVTVVDGKVVLSGPVLEGEIDDLVAATYSVRGVKRVLSRLEPHEHSENFPGLKGRSRVGRQRPDILQQNWAPGTRLLIGTSGALALAVPSGNRRIGVPQRLIGGLLLTRALTNLPLRQFFGMARSRRAIRFQKTITIHEPVERVFQFWSNPENFSRIMNHVQDVKRIGENRFRWIVRGPAGTSATWDSRVVASKPNQRLVWRSEPGSPIPNAGIVRFQSTGDGGTRVHLLMSYNPPAGAIGHAFANLFGAGPKQVLDEDLVRAKSLFEHGKTRAHGETVRRDEISA